MNKDIIHYFKKKEPIVIGYYFMENSLFIAPLSQIGRSSSNDRFYCSPVTVINQQSTMVENIPYICRDTSKVHLYLIEERSMRYDILERYLTKDSRDIFNKIHDLLIPENKIVFQGSSLVRECNNQVVVNFNKTAKKATNLLEIANERHNIISSKILNIGIFRQDREAYIVFDADKLKIFNSSSYEIYGKGVKVLPCENIELNTPTYFYGEYVSLKITEERLNDIMIYEKIKETHDEEMYRKNYNKYNGDTLRNQYIANTDFPTEAIKRQRDEQLINSNKGIFLKSAESIYNAINPNYSAIKPNTDKLITTSITKLSSKNKKSTKITIKPILKIK
jgi:hypothetical protein